MEERGGCSFADYIFKVLEGHSRSLGSNRFTTLWARYLEIRKVCLDKIWWNERWLCVHLLITFQRSLTVNQSYRGQIGSVCDLMEGNGWFVLLLITFSKVIGGHLRSSGVKLGSVRRRERGWCVLLLCTVYLVHPRSTGKIGSNIENAVQIDFLQ